MANPSSFQVESVRQVFNDGNHNAFTDLCRFRGSLYLTFRSCPDGHMIFPSSRIVVLRSEDAREWKPVFQFSVPDRDCRDPHFLVFRNSLFVYTGAWLCGPELPLGRHEVNDMLGYAAWSDDGAAWHGPQFLEGTYGHYVWRAGAFGGKAYLNARRMRSFIRAARGEKGHSMMESAMLESDDGLVWRFVGLSQEVNGDETAFLFEEDGAVVAVARSLGGGSAQLCRARPPYKAWTRADLGSYIGGPMLAKWGARYLVGGRTPAPYRTGLWWLDGDRLERITELPSGGDNSYPGFTALDDRRCLISYYSSHEGSGTSLAPSAIYLADCRLS